MRREQKAILRRAVEGHLRQQVGRAETKLRIALINMRETRGLYNKIFFQQNVRLALLELRMARYTYEAAAPGSRDK